MYARKAGFWLAVGGVAILANFAMELISDKTNVPGLTAFVDYLHRGPGKAAS